MTLQTSRRQKPDAAPSLREHYGIAQGLVASILHQIEPNLPPDAVISLVVTSARLQMDGTRELADRLIGLGAGTQGDMATTTGSSLHACQVLRAAGDAGDSKPRQVRALQAAAANNHIAEQTELTWHDELAWGDSGAWKAGFAWSTSLTRKGSKRGRDEGIGQQEGEITLLEGA